MKKPIEIYVFFLALALLLPALLTGCGEKGPADAAKEAVKSGGFGFANVSMDYDGGITVISEDISAGGDEAEVTLEADDGSRRWYMELEKKDGEWEVVDGDLELLEDVQIVL